MAKTPEGIVKDEVKKILERHNVWYFMTTTMGFGKSGVPDFVCCYDGKFISIETKFDAAKHRKDYSVKKGSPTPRQIEEMSAIRKHGGVTLLVDKDNLTVLDDYFRAITVGNDPNYSDSVWINFHSKAHDQPLIYKNEVK